jgi:hypothetical protein
MAWKIERVGDAAKERVVRPDGEDVLAVLLELLGVLEALARMRHGRVVPGAHVLVEDRRQRRRVLAVPVEPKSGMEDLKHPMGVHREVQPGDLVEVAVQEAQRALVVLDRAGHKQTGAWRAKADLHVDAEERHAERVLGGRPDVEADLCFARGIGHERRALHRHLADEVGIVEVWERQGHDDLLVASPFAKNGSWVGAPTGRR